MTWNCGSGRMMTATNCATIGSNERQSPRLEGRLSSVDSRPFLLTALPLTPIVAGAALLGGGTALDLACSGLSEVGATDQNLPPGDAVPLTVLFISGV